MTSGIITAILLIAFLATGLWAWSARNRPRWHAAAQLPLEDEPPRACCGAARENRP
jgi:cytochrome c oxidase cbb3-type subunit IV